MSKNCEAIDLILNASPFTAIFVLGFCVWSIIIFIYKYFLIFRKDCKLFANGFRRLGRDPATASTRVFAWIREDSRIDSSVVKLSFVAEIRGQMSPT